jgi:polyisoprenyl-phosphate glycosyltransferase
MSDRSGIVVVITPARNEAGNLEELHRRLSTAFAGSEIDWRWLLVDDASEDDTFAIVSSLASRDLRVGAIRLSRRGGSHAAILAGLRVARLHRHRSGLAEALCERLSLNE